MIMIQVKTVAKPELLEVYLEKAKVMARASQQEPGCVFFHLLQDANEKNVVYIAELWKNQEALDAHNQSSHYLTIVPELREMRLSTDMWKNEVLQ